MGAPATPSGSRAAHETPAGSHPSGFDPSRIRDFTPAQVKWLLATPTEIGASGAKICEVAGVQSPHSFSAFVRANSDLFNRHPPTPVRAVPFDYTLTELGAAIAMETRQGGDAQQAPSRSDDSAGPKDIAQQEQR